jgi:hypothetical protein
MVDANGAPLFCIAAGFEFAGVREKGFVAA